jgi:hypothetical protein
MTPKETETVRALCVAAREYILNSNLDHPVGAKYHFLDNLNHAIPEAEDLLVDKPDEAHESIKTLPLSADTAGASPPAMATGARPKGLEADSVLPMSKRLKP